MPTNKEIIAFMRNSVTARAGGSIHRRAALRAESEMVRREMDTITIALAVTDIHKGIALVVNDDTIAERANVWAAALAGVPGAHVAYMHKSGKSWKLTLLRRLGPKQTEEVETKVLEDKAAALLSALDWAAEGSPATPSNEDGSGEEGVGITNEVIIELLNDKDALLNRASALRKRLTAGMSLLATADAAAETTHIVRGIAIAHIEQENGDLNFRARGDDKAKIGRKSLVFNDQTSGDGWCARLAYHPPAPRKVRASSPGARDFKTKDEAIQASLEWIANGKAEPPAKVGAT